MADGMTLAKSKDTNQSLTYRCAVAASIAELSNMSLLINHNCCSAALPAQSTLPAQRKNAAGCDREFNYASTLQDDGVGFDKMLIGFSLDLRNAVGCRLAYRCLGSQLWVFLSSEESKKAITVSQP